MVINNVIEIYEYLDAISISGYSYKSFSSFWVLKCIEFGTFFLSIKKILIFFIIKEILRVHTIGLRKEFVKNKKSILVIKVLLSWSFNLPLK